MSKWEFHKTVRDIPQKPRIEKRMFQDLWDDIRFRLEQTGGEEALVYMFHTERAADLVSKALPRYADIDHGSRAVIRCAVRVNGVGPALYVTRGQDWDKRK